MEAIIRIDYMIKKSIINQRKEEREEGEVEEGREGEEGGGGEDNDNDNGRACNRDTDLAWLCNIHIIY